MEPDEGLKIPRPGKAGGKAGGKLKAWFAKNRGLKLVGLAAAAVAGYAVIRRLQAGGDLTAPGSDKGAGTLSSDQLQTMRGAAGYYDSTATDVYNSIQPQLDALAAQIAALSSTKAPPATGSGGSTGSGSTTPKPKPKPTPTPKPKPKPKTTYTTYTIKRGDTLRSIAKRYGLSLAQIKKLNPVFTTNPKYHGGSTIFAGGHVKVPKKK